MPSDRDLEAELLKASRSVRKRDIENACMILKDLSALGIESLSGEQIESARSSAFTVFSHLVACQRGSGVLAGVREHEYTSNLADAFMYLEQWNENNPAVAGQAFGGLEMVELMFQEDWDFEEQNAPGFPELMLVSRFVHLAIQRVRTQ